jgi:hypothetical protein
MIVRLLSIAKAIIRTCTLSDSAARATGSDVGEPAPQYFPAGESARGAMKSVAAQLSFSKGAWFHEDESPVNE